MFSQIAIVVLGVFLIVMGIREGNYVNAGLGVLVAGFAGSTIYRLKTGK